MTNLFFLIVGLAIGYYYAKRKFKIVEEDDYKKEKALELLKDKEGVSNTDLREALVVSERTIVRYMDELEKEGKVEQVGDTGRGVTYRLKP